MLSNNSNPFGNIMDYVEQNVKFLWHTFGLFKSKLAVKT